MLYVSYSLQAVMITKLVTWSIITLILIILLGVTIAADCAVSNSYSPKPFILIDVNTCNITSVKVLTWELCSSDTSGIAK